jgi:hypothetical protein
MTQQPTPLTVAISSRALFDLVDSNGVYETRRTAGTRSVTRTTLWRLEKPIDS